MNELASYCEDVVQKPLIAVITKMDLPENMEPANELRAVLETRGFPVYEISAVSGAGLKELLYGVVRLLKRGRSAS
jgi:GTP-binding protein